MKSLLSKVLFLASIKNVLIMATNFFDTSPECFDSCSKQVNCTVIFNICGSVTNVSQGPDIAAEPVDLKHEKIVDNEHQYINLQWRPPGDGSYNYLTGFLVQANVINHSPVFTGMGGTFCYKVFPASDWYKTHKLIHREGGVSFFLNCLRFTVNASAGVMISIHSLPLSSKQPKLAQMELTIEPVTINWNPCFDKWADSNDVMHLVITSPLREAHFYEVQIISVVRNMLVFSHVFNALPNNQSDPQFYMYSNDGLPHYLIPGLTKEDNNFSILMDVLDANKTAIAHMRSIMTRPFQLNFTDLATTAPSHGLDNRLIIIVSVVVIVGVAVLVCLIWKGVFRPCKLRNWIQTCSGKTRSKNNERTISFVPIYCHENEHFIKAVENHVLLLRRCLEPQSTLNSSQSGVAFCCNNTHDRHTIAEVKNISCDFIIYLSPRLGEILRFGHTCPAQCSRLDIMCHQALQSLVKHQQSGQETIPILVTFDCFQQAELNYIDELMALIFPPHMGISSDQSTPVRLASLSSGGYRIENVDVLYMRLSHHQDFTANTPLYLQGWRECQEARAVERHLSLLLEAGNHGAKDVVVLYEHKRFTTSPKLEFHHFSNNMKKSQDNIDKFYPDQLDKGHEDCVLRNNHQEVKFLSNSPQLLNSSDFQSISEVHSSNNSFIHDIHSNNNMKSSGTHYQVNLPSMGAITKDVYNYHTSYYHSPKEPHSYCRIDSNEISESVLHFQEQPILHTDSVVTYKPNVFGKNTDSFDSSSVNSADSDSLLKTNDLNGFVRRGEQFMNRISDNAECVIQKNNIRISRPKDIVPPSLNDSNFTSMESVCERINRVNEHSGWNQSVCQND